MTTKTPENILQYWATYPVGGSGMSVSAQVLLKNLSQEVLESRGIEIAKTHEETVQHD